MRALLHNVIRPSVHFSHMCIHSCLLKCMSLLNKFPCMSFMFIRSMTSMRLFKPSWKLSNHMGLSVYSWIRFFSCEAGWPSGRAPSYKIVVTQCCCIFYHGRVAQFSLFKIWYPVLHALAFTTQGWPVVTRPLARWVHALGSMTMFDSVCKSEICIPYPWLLIWLVYVGSRSYISYRAHSPNYIAYILH